MSYHYSILQFLIIEQELIFDFQNKLTTHLIFQIYQFSIKDHLR
nr:MAG TPA: hypothetical protein [Caudoviricetes sp.]